MTPQRRTPEERIGLIPTHVALRGELNELEQQNIAEASGWAFERKRNGSRCSPRGGQPRSWTTYSVRKVVVLCLSPYRGNLPIR
jgi:hypothetical protein